MNPPLPSPDPPAIELSGVDVGSASDRGQVVLRDVNWRVLPGEFWVVAGLLKSGKTDLLSMIAGALPPSAGDVRVAGYPVFRSPGLGSQDKRMKVGLVHDGGLLFGHLTVAENIALPLRYHYNVSMEEVADRVGAWTRGMGIDDMADQPSTRISRIWARRAGLARACVLQPEILLIDSPLSGLDPIHAQWWLGLLHELSAGHALLNYRPLTLIVTADHFTPWVAPGRKCAVLREGRLEVVEPTSDVASLNRLLIHRPE